MASTKKPTPPQFSVEIDSFIRLMDQAVRDYNWCFEEVGKMDRLTQDHLHKLELDGLKYNERAKLATKIKTCRRTRRECKDTTEILEPLVTFLASEKGKNMMSLMRETLGKTRKVEERMKTRRYYPRITEDDE